MLKKVMILAILALLISTPVQACLTAWFLGMPTEADNPEAEFRARFGLQMDDQAQVGETDVGVPEFGLQLDWVGRDGDYARYGVYAIVHLGTEASASTWTGRPYMGYAGDLAVAGNEGDGSAFGPVFGTRYGKIFVMEYQYANYEGQLERDFREASDEHKFYSGFCLRY